MTTGTTRFRGTRAGWRLAVAAAVLLAGLAGLEPAAPAAAQDAPTRGVVVVFPESDSVEIGNLADGQPVTVKVIRDGAVVASASGRTDLFGLFPVNRPPDPLLNHPFPTANCWDGVAPNIRAGDVVRYTYAVGGAQMTRETTTANLSAAAPTVEGGVLTVRGTASLPGGERPAVESLELLLSRLGQAEQFTGTDLPHEMRARHGQLGRPDEVAAEGTLAYDGPETNAWTARFPAANQHDTELALLGSTSTDLLWLGQEPAEGIEETAYEVGATGGTADFCTAVPDGAITDVDRETIDVATADQPLTVHGVASAAIGEVRVGLEQDGAPVGPAVEVAPKAAGAGEGQTWRAEIPAAALGSLGQGPFRVVATFVPIDQEAPEATHARALSKDTEAPAAPTATKAPGTYAGAISVNLEAPGLAQRTTKVHYTRDGSAPDRSSSPFTATSNPIAVTQSETIKAVAFDAAGNRSEVATFAYAIGTAGPDVVAVSPKRNARNVSTKADVTVTFDGAVTGADEQSVVLKAGARRVAATVKPSDGGKTITVDPNRALAPGTKYTVVLTAGIKDASGDALAPQSWSFTTRGVKR